MIQKNSLKQSQELLQIQDKNWLVKVNLQQNQWKHWIDQTNYF